MNFKFVPVLGVFAANLFIYGVFGKDPVIGLILMVESLLLYLSFFSKNSLPKTLVFLLLALLVIISVKKGFDGNLFKNTFLEEYTIFKRHEYLAQGIGKIYRNRVAIFYFNELTPILSKFSRNLFASLDINYLLNLENIFSLLFTLPFVVGIYSLISEPKRAVILYFLVAFLASGFLAQGSYGLYLFLPLVNLAVYLGLDRMIAFVRR